MLQEHSVELVAEGGETFRRMYRSLTFNQRQKLGYRARSASVPIRDEQDLALRLGYVRMELARGVAVAGVLSLLGIAVWLGFDSLRETRLDVLFGVVSASGPAIGLSVNLLRLRRVRDRLEQRWVQGRRDVAV